MSDKTLGTLKTRVLEALGEYSAQSDEVVICDSDRDLLMSRIPSAASAALRRMYESLDVGRKKSVQGIFQKKTIAYCPSSVGSDSEFEFVTSVKNIGLYFSYVGSGTVFFYSDNNPVLAIDCEGGTDMREMKFFANLEQTGRILVKPKDNLYIMDFSVYENDGCVPKEALCSNTRDSFSLPEDFDRLVSAQCEFGEIDKSLISTNGGYGFAPGFACRGAKLISLEYKRTPREITPVTSDDFVFEISSFAFDAFVYLTASELCREKEADIYTRLVYKYNDLSSALLRDYEKGRRNGFYKNKRMRRW